MIGAHPNGWNGCDTACCRQRGRFFLGAGEPETESDRGPCEHPLLSSKAPRFRGAGSTIGRVRDRGPHAGSRKVVTGTRVLHRRCAGLDVHEKEIVACVRLTIGGKESHEVRRFSTMTPGLLELSEWLSARKCTHVAMEATGVYWKPVWHVLEPDFELVLANGGHIRNVPGRKSDVNDATWVADLLAHGLIRASFVPPQPLQELRELTRTRKQIRREVVQHTQRIERVLEDVMSSCRRSSPTFWA